MSFESSNPAEQDQSYFERQFSAPEKMKLAGGMAEVVDISPPERKTEVPVLFAPGWSMGPINYKEVLQHLAADERRVISLSYPRFGTGVTRENKDRLAEYPPAQLEKALALLDLIDQKGLGAVNAIVHSESCIAMLIAATLQPEKFKNIILFAPPGLIGEDTLMRLGKGFAGQFAGRTESMASLPVSPLEKELGKRAQKEGLKYFLKNPLRALREAVSLSSVRSEDMLRKIHDKGVGIVIIHGVDDPMFPMERMQGIVDAGMVDGFLSVRGGHAEFAAYPEKYMQAAEDSLAELERREQSAGR